MSDSEKDLTPEHIAFHRQMTGNFLRSLASLVETGMIHGFGLMWTEDKLKPEGEVSLDTMAVVSPMEMALRAGEIKGPCTEEESSAKIQVEDLSSKLRTDPDDSTSS